jgi:hypothetical protein
MNIGSKEWERRIDHPVVPGSPSESPASPGRQERGPVIPEREPAPAGSRPA